jgi:uncharacterized protein
MIWSRRIAVAVALASTVLTAAARAAPLVDCPLRDAPFSADSPLVDVLRSPAAKSLLDKTAPQRTSVLPPSFFGTEAPTFAAIITLRSSERFTGLNREKVQALDRQLRMLPITDTDRVARCARYDNEVPVFTLPRGKPRLLLFEKINGFRDTPSVSAAHTALLAMARRNGWAIVSTDKGGAINPATLRRFDAVIWNNVSGDVLTLTQRAALKNYLEQGGGFVAMHGSAGDPEYFWDWYADRLIGARFKGHPMVQQFQSARIAVNKSHALARRLPTEWTMTDEWYSFRTNPRSAGANVVLALDERTYSPLGSAGEDLSMGDHPLAWTNCIGKGRMFYSAIGHRPETYSHPQHVALLEEAIAWAGARQRSCRTG